MGLSRLRPRSARDASPPSTKGRAASRPRADPVPDEAGGRRIRTEKFATTTVAWLTLRDWLQAHGVTQVAMESTGVYWKPVYYVLEEMFTCLLVNPAHVSKVPGQSRPHA